MGAKFTICCCQYYLKRNSEEKNAILRMRTTTASRQTVLSSESSDSEEESLFGPRPSRKDTSGSPIRRGSDRQLQAFISMRDQADKATELRPLSKLVKEVQCAGVKRLHLRRATEQYLTESDTCRCRPCSNNGMVVMAGDECKCLCKPGTSGLACEQGSEAEGQPGVIHGSWACWSAWSVCSGVRRTRRRSCSNPTPQNGGQQCIGEPTEAADCEDQDLQNLKTMEPHCFNQTISKNLMCGNPPVLINGYILEWEKLNYDIHSLRYARREVRSRWKKILLLLGYQCEVDALLCVSKRSRFSRDRDQLNTATELLKQLLDRTSLFPPETEHQSKYLCVMDRLVSLDSAEDFVRVAKEKYPKHSSLRDSEREKEDIKAEREKC